MANPRVTDLSDSDSDPSDTDIATIASPPTIPSLRARPPQPPSPQSSSSSSHPNHSQPSSHPSGIHPSSTRPFNPSSPPPDYKSFRCIYPLYFDITRSRHQGRRISSALAVPNPLAREIVDACQGMGLKTVFEPGKCHPKDWGNPGRVRVEIPPPSSSVLGRGKGDSVVVKNKHHLYHSIAQYLRDHPATPETPLRLRIQGMPPPTGPPDPPAVPKGWKINRIVPLHSPALSGGGVSENILRDMMDEMQGQQGGQGQGQGQLGADGGGGAPGGGGAGKRKREGKKK